MSKFESYAQGTPNYVELMTPDLPTATRFYSDVLGVGWDTMAMENGDYTTLMVGDRPVGGAMVPPMEGIPPYWSVYFNVESVDETVAQALELADPQGAAFNLMQSPADQ